MPEIILTEEQSRILEIVVAEMIVKNAAGKEVGRFVPNEAGLIAIAKQRLSSESDTIPHDKVRRHLEQLQEQWDRDGGFDEQEMLERLRKLRAGDRNG